MLATSKTKHICFYPDGGSTGGNFFIGLENNYYQFVINKYTSYIEKIYSKITSFSQGVNQNDDITLLACKIDKEYKISSNKKPMLVKKTTTI